MLFNYGLFHYGIKHDLIYENTTTPSVAAILTKTERAMVRSMCGVKLVDRKNNEVIEMLGLKETFDEMAKANGEGGMDNGMWLERMMIMFYRGY